MPGATVPGRLWGRNLLPRPVIEAELGLRDFSAKLDQFLIAARFGLRNFSAQLDQFTGSFWLVTVPEIVPAVDGQVDHSDDEETANARYGQDAYLEEFSQETSHGSPPWGVGSSKPRGAGRLSTRAVATARDWQGLALPRMPLSHCPL